MKLLFGLLASFILAYLPNATAQSVASADVNIVSVTATTPKPDLFVCTAVINNQNDDDSQDTHVIVLLPLQVQIRSMAVSQGTGSCRKGPLLSNFNGYAICDLGSLPQGPTVRRTITITTSKSSAGPSYPATCSAFIYSGVGDIDKRNNYKSAP